MMSKLEGLKGELSVRCISVRHQFISASCSIALSLTGVDRMSSGVCRRVALILFSHLEGSLVVYGCPSVSTARGLMELTRPHQNELGIRVRSIQLCIINRCRIIQNCTVIMKHGIKVLGRSLSCTAVRRYLHHGIPLPLANLCQVGKSFPPRSSTRVIMW